MSRMEIDMGKIITCVVLLLMCISLQGCKKDKVEEESEKNDKWIVANVYVYDSATGDPLQAKVDLLWVAPGGGGWLDHEVLKMVETNSEGIAYIEYKVPEEMKYSQGDYKLRIQRSGYQVMYGYPNDPRFGVVQSISIETENNINLALDPFYSISLSAINLNCTSPTDSVWIEALGMTYEYEAYGCADTTYPGIFPAGAMQDITGIYDTSYVDFQITTKKSGILNTYLESYNLTLGSIPTSILIEY